MRPSFLYIDEFTNLVTPFDAIYHSVARSAGGCSILIQQSKEALEFALGSQDAADSLLANCQTKVWCQGSSVRTNRWSSETIGSRYVDVDTKSVSHSLAREQETGSMQGGTSSTTQLRRYIEESEFS
jgi:type IV secretory pathway TraG/TraD family ATPase VirD4